MKIKNPVTVKQNNRLVSMNDFYLFDIYVGSCVDRTAWQVRLLFSYMFYWRSRYKGLAWHTSWKLSRQSFRRRDGSWT